MVTTRDISNQTELFQVWRSFEIETVLPQEQETKCFDL